MPPTLDFAVCLLPVYPPRSDFLDASDNQLTFEAVARVTFHSTFQSSVVKGKVPKPTTTAQLLGLDLSMFKRSERLDVFTHSIRISYFESFLSSIDCDYSIVESLVASADWTTP